jgi:hypothetical protein
MRITDNEKNNYIKPPITKQDIISNDVELFKQKLEGYIEIHPNNYEDIDTGLWVKYINKESGKYRCGGILKYNKYPDYFVLSSPYNNLTWSVNLNKNIFFIKDISIFREKMIEKNNLYKLYEAGLVKILESPE